MDFHQLEAFVSIAKYKSFSKAAEAIFLTQPTLSAHISSLENELGTPLFDRGGKEVSLTPAGRVFYDHALNLLNLRETAVAALNDFLHKITGRLEMGVSTIPCEYILPPVMQSFTAAYPDVTFSLREMGSGEVIQKILDGGLELGIVGAKLEHPKLTYIPLCDDHLMLITPNQNRFAAWAEEEISFADVKQERFIVRGKHSGTRMVLEQALTSLNLSLADLKIVAELDSNEAIKQAVKLGLGVSIISAKAAEDYLAFGKIRGFRLREPGFTRQFYLICHQKRTLSPLAKCFKDFLCRLFAKGSDGK